MNKILVLSTLFMLCLACNNPYKHISDDLSDKVENRLSEIPAERAEEIKKSIQSLPASQQEAIAYLYAYMPKADLDTLSTALIVDNVTYAYKAKALFPWAKYVPEEVFLNDVLPYAIMDETRENWRASFFEMLSPVLANTTDMFAAVDTINKVLKDLVQVEYNTKRNKPNQSPKESMDIHMASCSGLSILLTDALRAVGIPSRIAGTPMWITKEGNHNWNEVWVNGSWYLIEYYPAPLNDAWFLPRCAAFEGQDDPAHQVYATTFKPQSDQYFPMVWNETDQGIPGINVTDQYVELYKQQQSLKDIQKSDEVMIIVRGFREGGDPAISADRAVIDVIVQDKDGNQIAKGKTRNANADMNDYLVFYLSQNSSYKLIYGDKSLEIKTSGEDNTSYNLFI
ncbi:MAG: transglutaminase-like domain-containing protein [Bacteroidales bacterium]